MPKQNTTRQEAWKIFYKSIMTGFGKLGSGEWNIRDYHRSCAKMFKEELDDIASAEEHELMAEEWEREHGMRDKLEDLPF